MGGYRFIEKKGMPMIEITTFSRTNAAECYCTTRNGGVTPANTEYGTMNCNLYKPLDLENGWRNFTLFCDAIGVSPTRVVTNRLKHTDQVRIVDEKDLIDIRDEKSAVRCDSAITASAAITLFAYNSDCAIIPVVDPTVKVIALIHAGWKGSINGIIPKTIQKMKECFGCNPRNMIAAICPSIGKCCFEVGEEVAQKFIDYSPEFRQYIDYPDEKNPHKPHIDLFGVNTHLLLCSGILKENITQVNICTCCHPQLFHSYRRSPIKDGIKQNGVNGIFLKLT